MEKQGHKNLLWVLIMTVTLAVAGFSLPSPVLAPLLLDPAHGMLTPEASDWSRKVWLGVIMGLYPAGVPAGE